MSAWWHGNIGMTGHGIVTRSSWWDDQHWISCECGAFIKGVSRLGSLAAWNLHIGNWTAATCCCPVETPTDTQCVPCRSGQHTECVG